MNISVHQSDLPDGIEFKEAVAVDTETMGLMPVRDRLCLVQLSAGDGNAHLVRLEAGQGKATNLQALMEDARVTKIFHYARFDLAMLRCALGVLAGPVYCTKIASKLARTYTDRHGLRDLCRELLGVDLSKQQQSSDWGAADLTREQEQYAANDVLYLHMLREKLNTMLIREGRMHLANAAFSFLPARAELDLAGWGEVDLFAH